MDICKCVLIIKPRLRTFLMRLPGSFKKHKKLTYPLYTIFEDQSCQQNFKTLHSLAVLFFQPTAIPGCALWC